MRSRAALLSAILAVGLGACRPPGPPVAVGTELPRREPAVRVGIAVDAPEVVVGARGRYEVVGRDGRAVVTSNPDERWSFTAREAGRLEARSTTGRSIGPLDAPVRVRARRGGDAVVIGAAEYRGAARVLAPAAGRATAVNVLELEDYLLGVVPLEIGPRPEAELEAVKAQAVAARTYAIGHMGGRGARGFDFYATVSDQVYGGLAAEDPITSRAVRETRGEIVTYRGAPILAYYHSTCGGRTAGIDEVWRRAPVPYLRSVSDRIEGSAERYYCEISNRYRWTEAWSGEELRRILERTLAAHGARSGRIGRVDQVEAVGRTSSGRARALRIVVDGEEHEIRGDSIRWILRPEDGRILNSTFFVLDEERGDGLRASGAGWGHGIGMCQMGAIGRAREGQDYRRILSAYYRGTEVVKVY